MGRAVARQPFQLHRQIKQLADLPVILIFGRQFTDAVQSPVQRPRVGRVVRDQLGQPVDLTIAHLEHAACIFQNRARLHRPEGDDLRDMICAIFLLDIADDFAPPRFAEIDVEVRHRHTFRIEETFKQQPELDRIKIGNRQRPGDNGPCTRPTTGAHGNAIILRPFDEVSNDQEVAGKAHLGNDVELKIEALKIYVAIRIRDMRQPAFQPGRGIGAQLVCLACLVADCRQDRITLGRHDRTALRDDECVRQRLRQVFKQTLHLLGGLHPCVGGTAGTIFAFDIGAGRDAQHGIMRGVEVCLCKVGRVGGDERNVLGIGKIEQGGFRCALNRIKATGDFDVEPVGEKRHQTSDIGIGGTVLPVCQ